MTAREAAKDFIRAYVLRGDTIQQLAQGKQGSYFDAYHANIGGYIWNNFQQKNEISKKVGTYQIGVERVGQTECMEIFSLQEIYNEILYEKVHGKHEQLTLF